MLLNFINSNIFQFKEHRKKGTTMKKTVIKVCWTIICICLVMKLIFGDSFISFIFTVIGFFTFATYAIAVLINEEK